jgi:2-methylcitrate dehydratase PrpD
VEPYSQAIGRFVRGLSIDDVPQAVVDKAKLVLLDTIGVALASSTMQFGAMVTRVAQAFGVAEPVMLIRGRAGLEEFTDEAIHEPTMLALARKVRYELDSTIDYP